MISVVARYHESEQEMRRYWWVVSGTVLVWLVCVMYQPLFVPKPIAPYDDAAIQRDWWLRNNVSIYETNDTSAYRWLVVQPKNAHELLNRSIDHSLLRASAMLAGMLGQSSWYVLHMRLSSSTTKPLVLHGVNQTLTWDVGPQIRTYQLLVPYTMVPSQSHILNIANPQYNTFTLTSPIIERDDRDTRARIALWYGSVLRLHVLPITQWCWYLLTVIVPLVWAWWVARRLPHHPRGIVLGGAFAAVVLVWLWEGWTGRQWSLAPLSAIAMTTVTWYVLVWVNPRLNRRWPMALLGAVYVCALITDDMHANAVSQWMQRLDFSSLPSWSAFGEHLLQMRMAMPIPLLTLEYALYRSGIPGLLTVVYLSIIPRMLMLVGVMWALMASVRTPRHMWVASLMSGVMIAGMAFVNRYADRNYWMAYDAWFAVAVLMLWQALRRFPATPRGLIGIGFIVVFIDALRPFMQIITPLLVGVILVAYAQRHGWRRACWVVLPLSISVAWHLYHWRVLGQWSWSNYSGFNIARAWIPALLNTYLAQHAAMLQQFDMNSAAYTAMSAELMQHTLAWALTHPSAAVARAWTLVTTMLSIPVEMMRLGNNGTYYVLERVVPWYVWGYRVVLLSALVVQLIVMWLWRRVRRPYLWINAVLVWMLVVIMSLSEYGEQSRFWVSLAPLCLYIAPETVVILRRWALQKIRPIVLSRAQPASHL